MVKICIYSNGHIITFAFSPMPSLDRWAAVTKVTSIRVLYLYCKNKIKNSHCVFRGTGGRDRWLWRAGTLNQTRSSPVYLSSVFTWSSSRAGVQRRLVLIGPLLIKGLVCNLPTRSVAPIKGNMTWGASAVSGGDTHIETQHACTQRKPQGRVERERDDPQPDSPALLGVCMWMCGFYS